MSTHPTTEATRLGTVVIAPDGTSFTVVRFNHDHYYNRESDEFYKSTMGSVNYCNPCRMAGIGTSLRLLRTDLIPVFTLEGALA